MSGRVPAVAPHSRGHEDDPHGVCLPTLQGVEERAGRVTPLGTPGTQWTERTVCPLIRLPERRQTVTRWRKVRKIAPFTPAYRRRTRRFVQHHKTRRPKGRLVWGRFRGLRNPLPLPPSANHAQSDGQVWGRRFPEDLAPLADELIE